MTKLLKTVSFAFVAIFIESCNNRWTEKEIQDFAMKCSQTDSVENLTVYFSGFTYSEIEKVLVKQIHNETTVDSFYVFPNKNTSDSSIKRYSIYIDSKLYIKDSYQFTTSRKETFVLSNMEMIVWPQYTQFSEGYGCTMGNYTINGKKFEHNKFPDFQKGWK